LNERLGNKLDLKLNAEDEEKTHVEKTLELEKKAIKVMLNPKFANKIIDKKPKEDHSDDNCNNINFNTASDKNTNLINKSLISDSKYSNDAQMKIETSSNVDDKRLVQDSNNISHSAKNNFSIINNDVVNYYNFNAYKNQKKEDHNIFNNREMSNDRKQNFKLKTNFPINYNYFNQSVYGYSYSMNGFNPYYMSGNFNNSFQLNSYPYPNSEKEFYNINPMSNYSFPASCPEINNSYTNFNSQNKLCNNPYYTGYNNFNYNTINYNPYGFYNSFNSNNSNLNHNYSTSNIHNNYTNYKKDYKNNNKKQK